MNWRHAYNYFASRVKVLPVIREHLWLRQFIKFSVAGAICLIIDFLLYIFLTRLFSFWERHIFWANFATVIVSSTVNFIWNKNWTFRDKRPDIFFQYFKFWVIAIGGIILYQWIFVFLIKRFSLFDLLSKLIAAAIVWLIRFIFNKFWTFA